MALAVRSVLKNPQPSSTAFFLCDIQERFRPLIYKFGHVVNTASKMVAASKTLNIPLVVTEQHPKGLGNIVPELDISSAKLRFPKTKFSMMIPEIEQSFSSGVLKDTKSVVLFGIESHVCITQTALDLLKRDIQVYILADGVSSMNRGEIAVALDRLRKFENCTITSSDSILFQLVEDATHPNFKEISNLVKEHSEKTRDTWENLVLGYKNFSKI